MLGKAMYIHLKFHKLLIFMITEQKGMDICFDTGVFKQWLQKQEKEINIIFSTALFGVQIFWKASMIV